MESKAMIKNGGKHKSFDNKIIKKVGQSNLGKFYQKYEQLINLILDMISSAENMQREKKRLHKMKEEIRPNVIDHLNKGQIIVSKI